MNLCNNDHDEVCFAGRHCPACSIREDMQAQLDSMESDLKDALNRADELDHEAYKETSSGTT